MTTNLVHNLLGNTFPIEQKNLGNQIEMLCGAKVSTFRGADLGFWEVKSRKADSVSPISLGGKSTTNIFEVIEQVYRKIQNVILVNYTINTDNTFKVDGITLVWALDKHLFYTGLGRIYHKEDHHGAIVLRTSEKNFIKMYGRRVIRYE